MRTFVALLLVALAACSSAGAADTTTTTAATTSTTVVSTTTSSPSTTSTTTTTTTTLPAARSPLDGRPVDDPATLGRRVLAVKIDNHANARPQSGLDQAEAVIELLVEAGLTRFISLWHVADSPYLGPMRSGRPTDPTLLRPLDAVFAISGAQPWVLDRIAAAGVRVIGEVGPPATFRIRSRRAPHNLYVDTAALRDVADARGYADTPPARPWLPFGDPDTEGEPASEVRISFSPQTQVTWTFDGDAYLRSQGGVAHETIDRDGTRHRLAADTLVVLFAPRYTARPPAGVAGTPVPAMDTVGGGRALVFWDGQVREGRWSRDRIDEPFDLIDDEGDPLLVPAGRLWVSIVPEGRSVRW